VVNRVVQYLLLLKCFTLKWLKRCASNWIADATITKKSLNDFAQKRFFKKIKKDFYERSFQKNKIFIKDVLKALAFTSST